MGLWAATPSGPSGHLPLRGGFFAIALILAACSPKAEPPKPPAAVALDCTLGFEALKAKVTAQPGLAAAPKDPGEPYAWYNTADQATSYVVTEKGAPGHPAILIEQMRGGRETVSGCPYGNRAGYAKLLAYVESLRGVKR